MALENALGRLILQLPLSSLYFSGLSAVSVVSLMLLQRIALYCCYNHPCFNSSTIVLQYPAAIAGDALRPPMPILPSLHRQSLVEPYEVCIRAHIGLYSNNTNKFTTSLRILLKLTDSTSAKSEACNSYSQSAQNQLGH